jgi:hypothetical protein
VAEHMLYKCESLNSNPRPTRKKKRERERKKEGLRCQKGLSESCINGPTDKI